MQYHLGRDGTQLGSFPEDEIRAGLQNGRFLPTDLAWSEGMPDWKPLSEVLPGTSAAPSSPTLSLSKPGDGDQSSASVSTPQVYPPSAPVWQPQQVGTPHYGVGVMPTPGTAIASLVLGILTIVSCYFGVLFVIPAIICGHIALNQIKASGGRFQGKGLALAGLIMGYIWLGLCVLFIIGMVVFGAFASVTSQIK